MVHQGCWHGLPCLDPQADISAVQSIGPCIQQRRDKGPILPSLQTQETAWIPAVQTGTGKVS